MRRVSYRARYRAASRVATVFIREPGSNQDAFILYSSSTLSKSSNHKTC
jgi:hypothetical protein